jgi:glycosyltransferase involved in cell wall biosynthesis
MTPLLSVIVTVHNKAPFIKRCALSVLNQTYRNLELIIVDDGSTDNSGMLCDMIQAEDPRVRVIHQDQLGVVTARRIGTDSALGEYIHHVDGDDWLEPDMEFALTSAILDTGADAALTGYIDERSGKRWPAGTIPSGIYSREELERNVFPYMIASHGEGTMGLYSSLWTSVMRRSLIAPILRGVDPALKRGEDSLCLYQAVAQARSVIILGGSYYHYCVNPSSVTARPLPGHYSNLERLMRGYLSSPLAGILSVKRQLPNKFWYHVLHGDLLAHRSGKSYSAEELVCRARVISQIEALERNLFRIIE